MPTQQNDAEKAAADKKAAAEKPAADKKAAAETAEPAERETFGKVRVLSESKTHRVLQDDRFVWKDEK